MEIYFEEVFKYIQPGLLGKIEFKAYSDYRKSEVHAVNEFPEQGELECYQFAICCKSFDCSKKIKKAKQKNWIMSVGLGSSGTLFEKNIEADSYLINLFNQLIKEIMSRNSGYQYIVQSLNIQMLISILRIIKKNLNEGKGDKYYHKLPAEKALKYLSTVYGRDLFEKDIVRDYNYSHYHRTENDKTETIKIIKSAKNGRNLDMFIYSNTLNRKLLFKIKFKNNSYMILSNCEKEKSM